MKGMVVEKGKEYAIVLNTNGQFLEIKNSQEFNIGYEIDIPLKKKIGFKTIMAIAAVFIIIVGLSIAFCNCH
ncbi:MAG TPA: anti-sigma factor domain-containing protein [Clostridium sp.]|nr:anti-sigma factor domain-containing protein [Clostridium sp.]